MSHLRNYHNGRTCYGHAVTAYAYTFASNWDESGDACEFRLVILAGRPHREPRTLGSWAQEASPFRPGLARSIRVQSAYGSPAANWRLARRVGQADVRRDRFLPTSRHHFVCLLVMGPCMSIGGGSASSRRGRASAAGCSGSAASESRQRHMNCPERKVIQWARPPGASGREDSGAPHGLFRGRTTAGR